VADPLTIRKATMTDAGAIDALMKRSMAGLGRPAYDERQVASAVRFIASVDRQLIEDETYFVVECDGNLVGCGGWSRREKLFSGPSDQSSARPLDPARDPARVRAMFVDPAWARRGIGRLILDTCESEARRERFGRVELMATLSGEALYAACGYTPIESAIIELPDGVILGGTRMEKSL
jgi:GNAT superfamily N-acetyltransferase